jgi:hypothetical protein
MKRPGRPLNAITVSEPTWSVFPTAWVAQELGRTVEDTPDIWCYLNTSYLNKYPELKNFERWLYQRDTPGYETTPAEPISDEPNGLWMTSADIDHMAKRGENIGFAIDDRFIGMQPTKVAVKVSYLDQTAGTLTLNYQSPDGPQQKSIALDQDGKLKTATFIIDDLVAPAQDFGYDLTFSAPNEAVLSFVRIIKLDGSASYTSKVLHADSFDDGNIATATNPADINGGYDIAGDLEDPEIDLFETGGHAELDLEGATTDFPFVAMMSKNSFDGAAAQSLSLSVEVASLNAAHWWMRPLAINLRPDNTVQPRTYNPGTVSPPLGLSLLIGNQDNGNCRVALAASDGSTEEWLWEDIEVEHTDLADGFTATITAGSSGWHLAFADAASLPARVDGSWGALGRGDIFNDTTYVQCYLREDKNASKVPPQTGTARAEIASIKVTDVRLTSKYDNWSTKWGGIDLSDPLADYDNDNLTNFGEYALNGDPTNGSDTGLMKIEAAGDLFTFVHASNTVDSNLSYRLLDKTNLVSGAVLTNNWDSRTVGLFQGDYAVVSNHYNTGGRDNLFVQLSIGQQ